MPITCKTQRVKLQETDPQKKEGNSAFIHRQHQGDKLHLNALLAVRTLVSIIGH